MTHLVMRYGVKPVQGPLVRGGLTSRQLRRAQDIMTTTLDEGMLLAGLAQEVGLSPWHFSRAFRQSTGMSPQRWIRERKLERAQQLLADEHRSLTSIAVDLGYASLSHFSTAFKRATGISPRLYRRSLFE
jgi:AraC family transcriptional regulator